jgi:hypothetical protein
MLVGVRVGTDYDSPWVRDGKGVLHDRRIVVLVVVVFVVVGLGFH